MLLQVMEDASRRYRKPMEVCRIGRSIVTRWCENPFSRPRWRESFTAFSLVIAAATALLPSQPAWGQAQPQQAAGPLKATITDFAGSSQQITVPLNRSVAVETTVEVQRADVIAREIADVHVVSPTRLLITGESYGTTTVVLLGKDNTQYAFEVTVEMDVARLNSAFRDVDPLADVRAQSVRGNLILTGTVSSAQRAQRIESLAALFLPVGQQGGTVGVVQNHLDVAGEQQVLLRVVVAEVSRNASRELGVNGFLAGENMRDGFLVNQLGGINPINIGAAGGFPVTQNVPFVTGENGIPIARTTTLSVGFPRVQMQLFIQAMADNSLLSVLAEPNLVAISGETAHFLAGGEFPILVPQSLGTVSIEFREFGVRLNFTPVVRGQGKIRLRIAPEVSELDFSTAIQFQGFVVPGLRSRATETTVELGSGQTIAVAGLLSEQMRGVASRIPGLGDVPILGTLFRSVNYQRSLTELVVLVTPEMVSPLDAHQHVTLPNQGMQDPSDFELYALGLLERGEDRLIDPPHGYPSDGQDAIPSEPDELSIHGPWGPTGMHDGQ